MDPVDTERVSDLIILFVLEQKWIGDYGGKFYEDQSVI